MKLKENYGYIEEYQNDVIDVIERYNGTNNSHERLAIPSNNEESKKKIEAADEDESLKLKLRTNDKIKQKSMLGHQKLKRRKETTIIDASITILMYCKYL